MAYKKNLPGITLSYLDNLEKTLRLPSPAFQASFPYLREESLRGIYKTYSSQLFFADYPSVLNWLVGNTTKEQAQRVLNEEFHTQVLLSYFLNSLFFITLKNESRGLSRFLLEQPLAKTLNELNTHFCRRHLYSSSLSSYIKFAASLSLYFPDFSLTYDKNSGLEEPFNKNTLQEKAKEALDSLNKLVPIWKKEPLKFDKFLLQKHLSSIFSQCKMTLKGDCSDVLILAFFQMQIRRSLFPFVTLFPSFKAQAHIMEKSILKNIPGASDENADQILEQIRDFLKDPQKLNTIFVKEASSFRQKGLKSSSFKEGLSVMDYLTFSQGPYHFTEAMPKDQLFINIDAIQGSWKWWITAESMAEILQAGGISVDTKKIDDPSYWHEKLQFKLSPAASSKDPQTLVSSDYLDYPGYLELWFEKCAVLKVFTDRKNTLVIKVPKGHYIEYFYGPASRQRDGDELRRGGGIQYLIPLKEVEALLNLEKYRDTSFVSEKPLFSIPNLTKKQKKL